MAATTGLGNGQQYGAPVSFRVPYAPNHVVDSARHSRTYKI